MKTTRMLLDSFLKIFCCSLFITMIVISSWQVISRYVFNDPSTITEMLLRCLLVWISTTAIAYVVGQREHVSLTILTDSVNKKWQFYLAMFVEILFATFSIFVLIYGGWKATINTLSQLYPMLYIPKSIIYFPLVTSGIVIVIYAILNCHSLCYPTPRPEK